MDLIGATAVARGWRLWEPIARHRALAVMLFIAVLPWVTPYQALATNILIYGLFAAGFNLLYGYLGLLSFGHAALFGGGAYACGIAIVRFGLPWYAGLALGTLGGMAISLLIGALATRTRGIYFAMITLAFAQSLYYLAYQAQGWTGGENGLRGVNVRRVELFFLPLDFTDPVARYWLMAALVGLALLALSRILNSPLGAVIEAVRENEARARACGYDVAATRLVTFVLSGGFAGLAGALQALELSTVSIETLDYGTSGLVVMMTLLGGAGTFFGPFVGAAVFALIQDVFSLWTVHWQLLAGAIFMLFVLFLPRGIWGYLLEWSEQRQATQSS